MQLIGHELPSCMLLYNPEQCALECDHLFSQNHFTQLPQQF